eukprot:6864775-Prymnesium_polylepis.1
MFALPPSLVCCVCRVFADCVDRLTERNPCEEACAARLRLPAGDAALVPRRRVPAVVDRVCRWRVWAAPLSSPPPCQDRPFSVT